MLTPQEITKKEFDKAVIGGYVMASVDEFLVQLGQDYSALYKENAILKNKIKVLVDKVDEYRSTEDAMRMALLSAKKTAREINEEAESQKQQMLAEAEDAAVLRRRELQESLAAEEAALDAAKKKTADYLSRIRDAAKEYILSLDSIYDFARQEDASEKRAAATAEQREEMISETARSIENSIARIMEQSISSADDEDDNTRTYEPASAPSASGAKGDRIDMDNLKFGANYEPGK
ncbi:MAG: DivIVA domain-containing protein [Oscillospiraceae bacterium]|nr:DivIVA domain-containing protein [Oscillospiraceae bacterium]